MLEVPWMSVKWTQKPVCNGGNCHKPLYSFSYTCRYTHTHAEANADSMQRPRWLVHNGGAGQPLIGLSDWFQAWLALIESPQEVPGNHSFSPQLSIEGPGPAITLDAQLTQSRPPLNSKCVQSCNRWSQTSTSHRILPEFNNRKRFFVTVSTKDFILCKTDDYLFI